MHLRFILGSPVYQYFILFLVKSPRLHFVNCIISICCKRTSLTSSFNVSSKFNMFNITTRSCPKTSLGVFWLSEAHSLTRELRKSSWETILFQSFLVHNLFVTITPLHLKVRLGIKSMPYIFLWAPWTWIWSIVKVLRFSSYMKLGILLTCWKDFSFFLKSTITWVCLVINLHVWP